jgi:hypothetical protein
LARLNLPNPDDLSNPQITPKTNLPTPTPKRQELADPKKEKNGLPKSLNPRNISPGDEQVNIMRTLVGKHRLQVHHVAHDRVLPEADLTFFQIITKLAPSSCPVPRNCVILTY